MLNLKWLHYCYIFLTFGALLPMLINGPSDFRDFVENRSQLLNITYLLASFAYVFLFINSLKINRKHFLAIFYPTLLALLALLSVFWSTAPTRSFFIGYFLLSQIIAILFILKTMSYEDFFEALSKLAFITCILCVVFIIVIPSYGKMTYVFPGAWQGVFIHKNVLGRFAVFSFSLALILVTYRKNIYSYSFLMVSSILIVGCGSATALLGMFFILLTFISLKNIKLFYIFLVGFCVLIGFSFFFIDQILILLSTNFDKSITLSGRTILWEQVLININSKPLLGYGMGAFWGTQDAENIRLILQWFVPHAHNGMLEIMLQLGWIGGGLFLLCFLIGAKRSVLFYQNNTSKYIEWPILFFVFFVHYGLGEANYMRPNSFVQLVFVLLIAYTSKYYLERKTNFE
ncbi:O-antigen ligase family protein [Paraglaciecola sp.]|uniref:O-antigen ligase family protein n=1 Tax=Paraglaciecola sp. TaxID=1920173 RepID=UPI0030F49F67